MKPIPLVSIIIPIYKEAPYLSKAIESVLHQSYVYWELLLINDGSTDSNAKISLGYAKTYPRKVRYLTHPAKERKGLSASMNLGLNEAKGEYLALLNANDYWQPNKIVSQVAIIRKYPDVAMLCGACQSCCEGVKDGLVIKLGNQQDQLISSADFTLDLCPSKKDSVPCLSSIMVKKEVAIRHKGFEKHFNKRYTTYGVQSLFTKVALHESIYISSKAMDLCRKHKNSLTTGTEQQEPQSEVVLFYMSWLKKYLTEKKITNKKLWKKYNTAVLYFKRPALYKILQLIKRR